MTDDETNAGGSFARVMLILALALYLPLSAEAATCTGRWTNPITDICWSCGFPLHIGKIRLWWLNQEDNGNNPASPICYCPPLKVGVTLGFWEPARTVEVVREPFCMPALGGIKLGPSNLISQEHAQGARNKGSAENSFYHAHYYINPMLAWLEVLGGMSCLEPGALDLAYMTELDPLWRDDNLSLILNPEAVLFANPVAIAACAADCVAATAGFPQQALFWCSGCQGGMYPLAGHVAAHTGGVDSSLLLTNRLLAKMHRQLTAWGYHTSAALCGPYLLPVMDKAAYKTHMTYPIPNTLKDEGGRCCQPMGRTTAFWGAGKEFPYKGEDYAYMVWRKRNCCESGTRTKP